MNNNSFDIENKTTKDKINYLNNYNNSDEIVNYLNDKFNNFNINICDKYKGNIMELMNKNLLERWCYQTTETSILFLDNDSYIERGVLTLKKNKKYLHSWITFNFKNKTHIFDPCLKIITKKDLYYQIFNTELRGKVSSLEVKKYILKHITNSKEEIIINGKKDINYPIYGNNDVGYQIEIDNGNIKKLIAHYHINRYKHN
ncbi:MAG: hypothetical protein IKF19_05825 [Bacilli bacterium]|nr:hypothetical protein [Bacilli bacterium]